MYNVNESKFIQKCRPAETLMEEKEKNIFEYKVCKNRIIVKFYANVIGTNNIKLLIRIIIQDNKNKRSAILILKLIYYKLRTYNTYREK